MNELERIDDRIKKADRSSSRDITKHMISENLTQHVFLW